MIKTIWSHMETFHSFIQWMHKDWHKIIYSAVLRAIKRFSVPVDIVVYFPSMFSCLNFLCCAHSPSADSPYSMRPPSNHCPPLSSNVHTAKINSYKDFDLCMSPVSFYYLYSLYCFIFKDVISSFYEVILWLTDDYTQIISKRWEYVPGSVSLT